METGRGPYLNTDQCDGLRWPAQYKTKIIISEKHCGSVPRILQIQQTVLHIQKSVHMDDQQCTSMLIFT